MKNILKLIKGQKFLIIVLSAMIVFAACGDKSSGDPTSPPSNPPVKTVAVGAQSGTITAGAGGTATFLVTTENITNNSYTASVAALPVGISVSGTVDISGNSGTLTLVGDSSAEEGVTSLTLTINGATSASFSLEVVEPDAPPKSVSVGSQGGEYIFEGTGGNASYTVTTASIAAGTDISLNNINSVVGITLSPSTSATSGNSTNIHIIVSTATPKGEHKLTLTIDEITSNEFTLTVESPSYDWYDNNVSPFTISTKNELMGFVNIVNGTDGRTKDSFSGKIIKMSDDIDLSEVPNWMPIGSNTSQFTGTFDGDGNTISNLTIINRNISYQGLFGYIGEGGVVKNVTLQDASITSTFSYIGCVAGQNDGIVQGCLVIDCSVNVTGAGEIVGGVVGLNMGTVEYCTVIGGSVYGYQRAGGIVGNNGDGTTAYCYATCDISGSNYVGGIVGYIYSGTVKNCVSLNSSIVQVSNTGRVAGFGSGLSYNYGNDPGTWGYKGLTNIDGQDITPANAEYTSAFWTTAGNWDGSVWDAVTWDGSKAVWKIVNGSLPELNK